MELGIGYFYTIAILVYYRN